MNSSSSAQETTPPPKPNQQPQSTETDGGAEATSATAETDPSLGISLTNTPEETANDLATLIKTAVTGTAADSEATQAAVRIYGQLPKSTQKAILTETRTEISDEVFTLLAEHL